MAKAVLGAALIAGAVVGAIFSGGLTAAMLPLALAAISTAGSLGVSLIGGAIAQSLANQRGMGITTRQAAGPRQVIYGNQRVGGTILYESTTGVGGSGGNFEYNFVIAVASHAVDAITSIFLDGRQLYFSQDGNIANVGCGDIPTTSTSAPPTATATISGGAVTSITATGGTGLNNVKPTRYRVRIVGGGGTGAEAFATLEGGSFNSASGQNLGSAVGGTWTVTVTKGGSGYTTPPNVIIQGLYTIGGAFAADQQDPSQPGFGLGFGIGPSGAHFNFSGLGFCEIRFGDTTDPMTSLNANDPNWPLTAIGNEMCWMFLAIGFNTTEFPSLPEIRITCNGKNDIFDPRNGLTGYSTNWALQVADVITGDPDLSGLGDNSVNQAQLIAAANICDEEVPTSKGGESRYTQNLHWDTTTSAGDALQMMMPSAGGNISRVGGEWLIFPAAFIGPSFTMDQSFLTDSVTWTPFRKYRDLYNVVNGTFVAAAFPYSATAPFSNLYDQNGFWNSGGGQTDDLFPYAYQPTNFPPYSQDLAHNFASNQFLEEDGGITLPYELTLRGVMSIVQSQRLAKIELLRNRFQGSGIFPMNMAAWQLQPMDVVEFSFPQLNMSDALLKVVNMQLVCQPQKDPETGEEGALALGVQVSFVQDDPSIYEFDDTQEEQTPLDVPAFSQAGLMQNTPLPPTSMTVTSSAGTALISPGGTVIPRALVSWGPIDDVTVTEVDVQYQLVGATTFIDAGRVDVAIAESFVGPLVAGSVYNFQIRSVRPPSSFSEFVGVDSVTISVTLPSTITTGNSVAPPGTLTAQAFSGGTASIFVAPFTLSIGGLSVSVLPAGMFTISGLAQGEAYDVYYSDPNFLGGAITPIATQDPSVFEGVTGDFLIGTIVTPTFSPTFEPSTFVVSGTASVTDPASAFDGNTGTFATVSAISSSSVIEGPMSSTGGGSGINSFTFEQSDSTCVWSGFPDITLTSDMTLSIIMQVITSGTFNSASVVMSVNINGTNTVIETVGANTALNTFTINLTTGTNLGTMSVSVASSIMGTSSSTKNIFGQILAQVAEIFVN